MTHTIGTGALTVRPLDPSDDAQLRRFHEIAWRAEREDGRPWNLFWPYPLLAGVLREPTADQRTAGRCVYDGAQMVGAGLLELPLLDNLDKAYVFPTVEPELRGQGIGSRLLEALVDEARREGRSLVLSGAAVPVEQRDDAPVHRFAGAHGFSLGNTEIYRVLSLPVAADLLDRLADESAPHHPGYRVETFVDDVPERYLPSLCHLRNQLAVDAPSGEVDFEEEGLTPQLLLEKVERARRAGRRTYVTVATRDGEVVAHSDLFVVGEDRQAQQAGTLVHRGHRGHRLGTTVKVANLRALQRAEPRVTEVHTGNAETNRWMVDINVRLGFEVVGIIPEYLRRL